MNADPPKKWQGPSPVICDICQNKLKKEFVDGATTWGPWGIMCPDCFKTHGRGLGPGRGQRYNLATLVKLEG